VLDLLETAILGRHLAEDQCSRADNKIIGLAEELQRVGRENEELHAKVERAREQCTQVEKKASEAQRAFLDAMHALNQASNILNELVRTHPECDACHGPAIARVIPCNHLTCGRCGAGGCRTSLEEVQDIWFSDAQAVLQKRTDDIKAIAAFKTASARLVEKWEGEVVSEDEGSEIEALLLP
ncbi:hypothetical protein GGF50DRAFT_93109, partial [Schizophyllum commune]